MTFDVEAFWKRIETEPCPEGGRHELVNEDLTDKDDGPWFTTCQKCWRNFDAQMVDEEAGRSK